MPRIHANARTTPRIRLEIQQAPASVSHRELARAFLNTNLCRSRRYLRRHGVSNLRIQQQERESLEQHRYLFVAIDRATHSLANVLANAPFVVRTVLTDNGKEFSDRFTSAGERQITGRHPFDRLCGEKRIARRLIQPRHPQTNGIVERFNGRIAEILRA